MCFPPSAKYIHMYYFDWTKRLPDLERTLKNFQGNLIKKSYYSDFKVLTLKTNTNMSPNANENIVCHTNSSSGKKRCIDTNEWKCPMNNLNSSLKSHNSLKRRRIVSSDELSTLRTNLVDSSKIQPNCVFTLKNYTLHSSELIIFDKK